MSTIVVSRVLPFAVKKVWEVLADFGGIHRFHAGLESSPINPGTPDTGKGSERTCHLYDGNHIQERVTEFVEEERLGIDIFETSMPLRSGSGVMELRSVDGGCEVVMTMTYVVKFGLIGRAMDAMMMKRMMTKSLGALLAGLGEHIATGKNIEKGWKPSTSAAA
jgi:uncharacterized protein YndB with AHSA1/START domain